MEKSQTKYRLYFKKISRIVGLALLFLYSCPILFAQKPLYKVYNRTSGLPSDYINYIYQDKKGFLWIATDKGICRYDGKNFKIFNTDNGLASNMAYLIFEDSKGRVWFSLYGSSICYYDGHSVKQLVTNRDLVIKDIKHIYEDAYKRLYFVDKKQIFIWDEKELKIREYNPSSGAISVYATQNKRFVVKEDNKFYLLSPSLLGPGERSIYLAKNAQNQLQGDIYVSGDYDVNGLVLSDKIAVRIRGDSLY